jgi:hypothetical protein
MYMYVDLQTMSYVECHEVDPRLHAVFLSSSLLLVFY